LLQEFRDELTEYTFSYADGAKIKPLNQLSHN